MPYSYTSLPESNQLVVDLTDIGTAIKLQLIDQNLADSAGVKVAEGPAWYRPYYVAARQIQRNRDDVTLKSADGAVFDQLTVMIRSLLEEQIALDDSLALIVPDGYNASTALENACGCGTKTATAAATSATKFNMMTIGVI